MEGGQVIKDVVAPDIQLSDVWVTQVAARDPDSEVHSDLLVLRQTCSRRKKAIKYEV